MAKKKTSKKKTKKKVKKKAAKKKAKKKVAKKLPKTLLAREEMIKKKLADMEKKLIENYRVAVEMSGKDWKKEKAKYEKKVKAQMRKAEKTVKQQIRKAPESSAVAAAALGAVLGAVAVGLVKRKK